MLYVGSTHKVNNSLASFKVYESENSNNFTVYYYDSITESWNCGAECLTALDRFYKEDFEYIGCSSDIYCPAWCIFDNTPNGGDFEGTVILQNDDNTYTLSEISYISDSEGQQVEEIDTFDYFFQCVELYYKEYAQEQ